MLDHYVAGKTVFEKDQAASLSAGQTNTLAWALPKLAPGFYYATLEVLEGERKLTDDRRHSPMSAHGLVQADVEGVQRGDFADQLEWPVFGEQLGILAASSWPLCRVLSYE